MWDACGAEGPCGRTNRCEACENRFNFVNAHHQYVSKKDEMDKAGFCIVVSTAKNMQRVFPDSCSACCLGCLLSAYSIHVLCLVLQPSCPTASVPRSSSSSVVSLSLTLGCSKRPGFSRVPILCAHGSSLVAGCQPNFKRKPALVLNPKPSTRKPSLVQRDRCQTHGGAWALRTQNTEKSPLIAQRVLGFGV